MGYEKELAYQEYVQRENMVLHAPYTPELEFYSVIQSGDVEKTRELCRQSLLEKEGLGVLSKNRLRHFQYHFVITTAIVARYCIRGGMELSVAYSLSDFYIQKVDICQKPEEINELHTTMCLDYAKRMKNLRKKKICSSQVAKCLDYIYEHMHTRITVEILAEHVKLSPGYLSRLFKKELGVGISEYIRAKKIETAKNMLVYSEYTPSEIASTLAFPSQSYFTEIFRKQEGVTPGVYRAKHLREVGIT